MTLRVSDMPAEFATVQTVLKNAERLLQDASAMHQARSFATCVGLCILAIEESGKCIILAEDRPMRKSSEINDHRFKQRVIGEAFDKMFLVEALRAEQPKFERWLNRDPEPEIKALYEATPPQQRLAFLHAFLSQDPGKLRAIIKEHQGPDETAIDFGLDVARGKIDRLRESAFYVDVNSGKVARDPATFGIDEADVRLEQAEFSVHLARSAVSALGNN